MNWKLILTLPALLASLAILPAANVHAQYYSPGYYTSPPYGTDYNFGGRYATTPAQGYAYGMSDLIRSQAAAQQASAQAAVIQQQAQREAIETHNKSVQSYFELRRMNAEYRAAEEAQKASLRAAHGGPTPVPLNVQKGLSLSQLDPVTGRINWTPVLMGDEFREHRQAVDAMFASRAELGRRPSFTDVQARTHAMRETLDAEINELAPLDWLAAKKLLDGLEQEIRVPLG